MIPCNIFILFFVLSGPDPDGASDEETMNVSSTEGDVKGDVKDDNADDRSVAQDRLRSAGNSSCMSRARLSGAKKIIALKPKPETAAAGVDNGSRSMATGLPADILMDYMTARDGEEGALEKAFLKRSTDP